MRLCSRWQLWVLRPAQQ